MRIFLARRRNPLATDAFYAIFSSVMLLFATIWISTTSLFGLNMWLLDRTYPGGPSSYMTGPPSLVTRCIMLALSVLVQQMADGLMVRPTQRINSEPYPFRSRCTAVGSCGTAFVSSLYPPSCGSQLWVRTIFSLRGAHFNPCRISHRLRGRGYTRARSLCPNSASIIGGILRDLGLPEHIFDVHDLLSVIEACEGNEGVPWRTIRISVFHSRHARRRVGAAVHAHRHFIFCVVWGGK
jgi:hypothetical protein